MPGGSSTGPGGSSPRLSGGWGGASIHILGGEGWYAQSGTVIASAAGSLTFRYTPDNSFTVERFRPENELRK